VILGGIVLKDNGRYTITEVAEKIGVTTKTIMRWEKAGKVKKPKRDWKGWRVYMQEDLDALERLVNSVYEI
jgi:MerR family transcriptional regulator, light-induced transcriptional regulator